MIGHPKPSKKKKRSNTIPKKIVLNVFIRDEGICQKCGMLTDALIDNDSLPSAHCHHVKYRSQCGKDIIENLITICHICHRLLHDGNLNKKVGGLL